jgi:hypothetical protein
MLGRPVAAPASAICPGTQGTGRRALSSGGGTGPALPGSVEHAESVVPVTARRGRELRRFVDKQPWIKWSRAPLASRWPLGEKLTEVTLSVWPGRMRDV